MKNDLLSVTNYDFCTDLVFGLSIKILVLSLCILRIKKATKLKSTVLLQPSASNPKSTQS